MKLSPTAGLVLADPVYARLKEHVIEATGLAYYSDKDLDLAERLARRLAQVGLLECASYLALLAAPGTTELDALIEDLTIGETFFFRHRELFDALRDVVLPDLVERNRASRQLRIWSAGCSTGAEPYSLAILCRRDLGALLAGWDVRIVGTDINRRFLSRAQAAEFDDWALRATPDEVRRACFLPRGKTWELRPEYRAGVSFQYHNLVTDHFPSRVNDLFAFDLILCRNVTIYFNAAIVRRIIGHFHASLVDGGWLLVGHSEPNMELFQEFRAVNAPGAVLYQKQPVSPAPVALWQPAPAWSAPSFTWAEPAPAPAMPPPTAPSQDVAAIRTLADQGAWEEAARRCAEALAADRLNPLVYFYHGLVLQQLGRHTDAEQALRGALYLDRGFVLAHYCLGLLLQKQGERVRAERSFRNVLDLLARAEPAQVFAEGDGITAAELTRLAEMNLEVLEQT